MSVQFGQKLISSLMGANAAGNVNAIAPERISAQTEYNSGRGILGNPNQPETRVKGLQGDNVYYFA